MKQGAISNISENIALLFMWDVKHIVVDQYNYSHNYNLVIVLPFQNKKEIEKKQKGELERHSKKR